MNKKTKLAIAEIAQTLSNIKAQIDGLNSDIEIHRDEEQEKCDNCPYNLILSQQQSDRVFTLETLDEVYSMLADVIDNLGDAVDKLEELSE